MTGVQTCALPISYSSALGLGNASGTAGKVIGYYNQAVGAYTTAGNLTNANGSGSVGSVGGAGSGGGAGCNYGNGSGDSGGECQGGSGGGSGQQGNGGGADYLCPPGIMPFGLAFQSDLDSFFWRGLVPLESIYPAPGSPAFVRSATVSCRPGAMSGHARVRSSNRTL